MRGLLAELAALEPSIQWVVVESMTKSLRIVARDFADAELQLWSQDPVPKRYGQVNYVPWETVLSNLSSSSLTTAQ